MHSKTEIIADLLTLTRIVGLTVSFPFLFMYVLRGRYNATYSAEHCHIMVKLPLKAFCAVVNIFYEKHLYSVTLLEVYRYNW